MGVTRVLLINQETIPHYRIPVYNDLSAYLAKDNYALTVVSAGTQPGAPHRIRFDHRVIRLSLPGLARLLLQMNPDVVIYWVRLRHLYLFPILLLIKALGKKAIYWGHGSDLYGNTALRLKHYANSIEYRISDALILYGEHLRKNVHPRYHGKIFIANNTLSFTAHHGAFEDKNTCLAKYGISTSKNIICTGRMQTRKRLEDLLAAFELLDRSDTGLIFVGPDTDGILRNVHGDKIYKLGPIYGDEALDLLAAADVFCLPGAVGLSIVDAFYCGLPLVTEEGDESPELMYLKNGLNGFVVPRGDVAALSAKLSLLLEDDGLRKDFSLAARHEIMTTGHIDKMCRGFRDALRFAC